MILSLRTQQATGWFMVPRYALRRVLMSDRFHEKTGRGATLDGVVQRGCPEEAIRDARDVVSQLARTVNTRRNHLPNNPIYHKFLGELSARVQRYIVRWEPLVVGVHRFEFQYGGDPTYSDSD